MTSILWNFRRTRLYNRAIISAGQNDRRIRRDRRVLAGDGVVQAAVGAAGPVTRMIRNVIGDDQACEELAQDVFLAAYEKLGTFDPGKSRFSTWLFTIARNKGVNAARKKRPIHMADLPERTGQDTPEDTLARAEFLPRWTANYWPCRSTADRLRAGQFEHLPYGQIAQIEGVRLGTVKSRISRADSSWPLSGAGDVV
jgi:RNA polymerase sigma-70 factor (ECF subfamily)